MAASAEHKSDNPCTLQDARGKPSDQYKEDADRGNEGRRREAGGRKSVDRRGEDWGRTGYESRGGHAHGGRHGEDRNRHEESRCRPPERQTKGARQPPPMLRSKARVPTSSLEIQAEFGLPPVPTKTGQWGF